MPRHDAQEFLSSAFHNLGGRQRRITDENPRSPMAKVIPPPVIRFSIGLRLLLAAICAISIGIGARQTLYYWNHGPRVTDLKIFMTGVEMLRSGQADRLYRFDAQESTQVRLYPETRTAGLLPFNHLAYELLLYWPVSRLPYRTALLAWAGLNVALLFLIARLIEPCIRAIREAAGIPILLYLLAFYPAFYVLGEGQDSIIFLCLVALSWRCAQNERRLLSGFVLGLAMFKFHLALLIAFFAFMIYRRWRALWGFAAGGTLVAMISRAMVGPGFFHNYISLLREQEVMTPWGFVPWFMPNLRGILQWALGHWLDIGDILPIIFAASIAVVIVTAWIGARSSRPPHEILVYSAAISAALLVSYHLHMQDLTLAVLPMFFLVDLALRGKVSRPASAGVAMAIAGLYLYRIAAVFVPTLLVRGCLLAIPTVLIWWASMTALRKGSVTTTAIQLAGLAHSRLENEARPVMT
jgi:hypothetical protein